MNVISTSILIFEVENFICGQNGFSNGAFNFQANIGVDMNEQGTYYSLIYLCTFICVNVCCALNLPITSIRMQKEDMGLGHHKGRKRSTKDAIEIE